MSERSGYRNGRLIYPISVLDTKPHPNRPGPNTVGTEEVIDGSILSEDLNQEVSNTMTQNIADSMEVSEQNGDVTISYDDGT